MTVTVFCLTVVKPTKYWPASVIDQSVIDQFYRECNGDDLFTDSDYVRWLETLPLITVHLLHPFIPEQFTSWWGCGERHTLLNQSSPGVKENHRNIFWRYMQKQNCYCYIYIHLWYLLRVWLLNYTCTALHIQLFQLSGKSIHPIMAG